MKNIVIMVLLVALGGQVSALDAVVTRMGNVLYGKASETGDAVTLLDEEGVERSFAKGDVTLFADFAMPQPKEVAKKGNFEVINGVSAGSMIGMNRFREAMLKALSRHRWVVWQERPGEIFVRLAKEPSWWVTLRICYTPSEYWYEYLDSRNLDANPKRDRIHRNYRRWIATLEKEMVRYY